MGRDELLGSARVRRRVAELPSLPVNFTEQELLRADPREGWKTTNLCQPLVPEPPGPPLPDGSWQVARRLMCGYEFADPSIVRAYYDPDVPLQQRNMLLKLQSFGVLHLYVGVRVVDVYEQTREVEGRPVHVWGWAYRTLHGHVEMGQMDWQVWKWPDSGAVEFRVHAVSRTAPIPNPIIRLGFALLEPHERGVFLDSTKRRMREFVSLALEEREEPRESMRQAAERITARPGLGDQDAAHDELARKLEHSG